MAFFTKQNGIRALRVMTSAPALGTAAYYLLGTTLVVLNLYHALQ